MPMQRYVRPYMWTFIVAGAAVIAYAAAALPVGRLDLRLLPLVLFTLFVSSRLCVPIPRTTSGKISFSDALIFLVMLLYGGEVAVLLGAAEIFIASRFVRPPISFFTSTFNAAMMGLSTLVTYGVLTLIYGDVTALARGESSAAFVSALCVMALVQYVVNTAIVSAQTALKANEPLWTTWRNKYLWTSITYFGGASAAGITVKLAPTVGLYALVAAAPIIVITYLTYRTYLNNIEAMSASALAAADIASMLLR